MLHVESVFIPVHFIILQENTSTRHNILEREGNSRTLLCKWQFGEMRSNEEEGKK